MHAYTGIVAQVIGATQVSDAFITLLIHGLHTAGYTYLQSFPARHCIRSAGGLRWWLALVACAGGLRWWLALVACAGSLLYLPSIV